MSTGEVETRDKAQCNEQPSVLQKLQKWGDYEAYGDAVNPTRFVPMKTPLGSEILQNWNLEEPPRHSLSIASLLQSQEEKGRRIGLIVDLSNHETLYGADLRGAGVQYERVPLIAKVFPTQQAVNKVIEVADRFWSEHPDLYIAIHCAYGFNRTGFVVCSYLVQACNLSVRDALESFAAARPPGVRHEQFVAELHRRYDGFRSERPIPCPPSLSDLRGYATYSGRQQVSSLQSDFMGVAEHLQESHPGVTDRVTGSVSTQGSLNGNSDSGVSGGPNSPLHASFRPVTRGRGHLTGTSMLSLEGRASNCESVNNESLDLDEREIYKHFANRQAAGSTPAAGQENGHHRQKGIKSSLPALRHSEDSNHSSSRSSMGARPSPFASVQGSADTLAGDPRTSSGNCADGQAPLVSPRTEVKGNEQRCADDSLGVLDSGQQSGNATLRAQEITQHSAAKLLPSPLSERIFKGGFASSEKEGRNVRRGRRPGLN